MVSHGQETFKVITFNLRKDSYFDRQNRWRYRKQLVLDFFRESGAAIIGVQELLPAMREDIQSTLSGYSIFGNGRSKKHFNEHSDIIIKNDEVEVDFSKTIWLSKHPEKFGSRAFLSFFPRICTICEVKFRESGRRIRVFNAHFDHISSWARRIGVEIILKYMERFQKQDPMPMVLMGDFNVKPHSKLIQRLSKNLHQYQDIHLVDAYTYCEHPEKCTNTYHGFKGITGSDAHIDYIFVSSDLEVVNTYVDYQKRQGKYLSDHYPIIATLSFKD